MTIRPGEAWGSVGAPPADVRRVDDDAALRQWVEQHGGAVPSVAMAPRRGDCWRASGGRAERDRVASGDEVAVLPWDVLEVEADGRRLWAVAHVVARGRLWTGELVALMNVDHRGSWDVAPRAHPNDGRVDVVQVEAGFPWRARWQARRRLPLGTHLPHPGIRVRQAETAEFRFTRPRRLFVDGVAEGSVRMLRVRVHPDRLVLCV